jgi:hypothetical protein
MQDHVFDVIGRDAVLNALQGFNSTIFAYGQVRPMHAVIDNLVTWKDAHASSLVHD